MSVCRLDSGNRRERKPSRAFTVTIPEKTPKRSGKITVYYTSAVPEETQDFRWGSRGKKLST